MKKQLVLIFSLLVLLCGCHKSSANETALLFYPRYAFDYGNSEPVMVNETVDITGHSGDISYLLRLYLMGPQSSELYMPFPENTQIFQLNRTDNQLEIILSDSCKNMKEIQFSLACGCLARSCFAFSGVDRVVIQSGEKRAEFWSGTMVLEDSSGNSIIKGGT